MTVLLVTLLALLFVVAPSTRAHASCNAIPEGPVMFFGELGSVDRPFVSPDPDEVVTVRSVPGSKVFAAKDALITIIFKPPAEAPRTFYIAGNDECEPLEEPTCFLERLLCHRPRTCFTGTSVGLNVGGASDLQYVSFHFPETNAAGPVTIAVTRADREGRYVPPVGLRERTCQDFIESNKESNLTICVDKLRPPPVDPPGDPTFAELVALPPSYDYRSVCTHSIDDPKCLGSSKEIAYALDTNGDVLIPVNWRNILRVKDGGPDLDRREMRASTTLEAVLGQGKRIIVPSAAFLETTTQQGGGFSPSPEFIPATLSDRPFEQTFVGTADKAKSVLRFARRKLWDHVCGGGVEKDQACEPGQLSQDCAQCVQSAPGYFACVDGDRKLLPCTQTAQCPQGACQRVSTTGSVCYTLDGTPVVPEKKCWQDSDCGALPCGPGLFEFRGRKDGGVLKQIASDVPGVCDSGITQGNACRTSSMCLGSAQCVTYRAEALTYQP